MTKYWRLCDSTAVCRKASGDLRAATYDVLNVRGGCDVVWMVSWLHHFLYQPNSATECKVGDSKFQLQ